MIAQQQFAGVQLNQNVLQAMQQLQNQQLAAAAAGAVVVVSAAAAAAAAAVVAAAEICGTVAAGTNLDFSEIFSHL